MDQFKNKRVLVIGGLGFIGSNFVRRLHKDSPNAKIIIIDKPTYSGNINNLADIKDELIIHLGVDIADQQALEKAFMDRLPDYVINFAAETHVDRSIHNGGKYFIDTNITGVYNILELCKRHNVRFVQVSTDEVFGSIDDGWFHSESQVQPSSLYSATKAGADHLCLAFYRTWGVNVSVTHCSNNYGPYQYPEKQIPFWVHKILNGERIPIYGDGTNVRDWVHVDDHVTALGAVLTHGDAGKSYLIGADNERTNLEMAHLICSILKKPFIEGETYMFVADRPGHDKRYAIDTSEIRRELGWIAQYGRNEFEDKLAETIHWYIDNKEWIADLLARNGESNKHI